MAPVTNMNEICEKVCVRRFGEISDRHFVVNMFCLTSFAPLANPTRAIDHHAPGGFPPDSICSRDPPDDDNSR
jgi:hypothetical protein